MSAFDARIDLTGLQSLNGLAQRVQAGIEGGLDKSAIRLKQAKEREINRTYGRSIPRSATGNPLWDRTGDWQGGQEIQSPSQYERVIVTVGPAAAYEERLANLPVGAGGVNRSNPAAERAQALTEPQLAALIEQEIANRLGI